MIDMRRKETENVRKKYDKMKNASSTSSDKDHVRLRKRLKTLGLTYTTLPDTLRNEVLTKVLDDHRKRAKGEWLVYIREMAKLRKRKEILQTLW